MTTTNFVRKVLADKNAYLVNGNSSNDVKAQIEYKDIKSPAVEKLELLSKGKVLIPRWLVYTDIPKNEISCV